MSSSKPQTQTTTSDPWSGQQPYLLQAFQGAQDLYNSGAPEYYPDQTVADQNDFTGTANAGIQDFATNGSPVVNAGKAQLTSTINGDYLNSNPYLDATYDKAASRVTDNYNNIVNPGIDSQFALGGRYGANNAYGTARESSDQRASDNLNDLATSIYGGNYATERQNQLNATNTAATYGNNDLNALNDLENVGAQQQQYNQSQTDADINKYNYNAQAPYNNLANYLGLIQGNYGNSSTQTANSSNNGLAQGLGLALSAASLFSDIDLKENIEYHGEENGHSTYKFNYEGDDTKYIGVIAQEVKDKDPEAVIDTPFGMKVNYDKIGVTMRRAE